MIRVGEIQRFKQWETIEVESNLEHSEGMLALIEKVVELREQGWEMQYAWVNLSLDIVIKLQRVAEVVRE